MAVKGEGARSREPWFRPGARSLRRNPFIFPKIRNSSPCHARWRLPLACLQFRVEQPDARHEFLLVHHAAPVLEDEGEELPFVETRLGRELAQLAITVFGHRDLRASCEPEAFRHGQSLSNQPSEI